MKHLLDLLAAIALLIWGTQLVRTGILRAFGANLRQIIAHSVRTRLTAVLSGIGVTALVQSSTATALIVSSFVGQELVTLPAALAVMLGADIGTAAMAVVFSFDLSWLSPLSILSGMVLMLSNKDSLPGRIGRIMVGLGLMLLALRLIHEATTIMMQAPAINAVLGALGSDRLLEITVGAMLAMMAYSSLATVLLTATLVHSGGITLDIGIGLVLGANLGSGLLAVLTTMRADITTRQVPLGNFLFKIIGIAIMTPLAGYWQSIAPSYTSDSASMIVLFHLAFNALNGLVCITLTQPISRLTCAILRPTASNTPLNNRPQHLDTSALATPSLAISCAAREALHLADVVETMLIGVQTVVQTDHLQLSQNLRKLDDEVDRLYSAIKYYLTKISRETLDEHESRRWADIMAFTINMEQIGDIIERVLLDIEDKKIRKSRHFSEVGLQEITDLHTRLLSNLRLAMSVFLNGNLHDAQKLMEEKIRFRELEHAYAASHLARLSDKTLSSIETSSLHIDLISELKRINSLLCSVAYPILESAGALAPSRLRPQTPIL